MEIAELAAASGGGGCNSIRDLPPSKRFKFVGSQLGSNPCMPLPAKKRAFPPPPAVERVVPPMPETASVSACLPAKKRAYAPAVAEGHAVKVCLPVKKRMYAPAPDAIVPACLPAKKRGYMTLSPPEDAAAPPSTPAKKHVHPPRPPEVAAASLSIPAKKHVHPPPPPVVAAASLPIPAKKRVHPPVSPEVAAASPSIPAKKCAQAPLNPEDAAALAPVCLPANKRVMPPFIPLSPSPSPSMESDGARVAAVKGARPPQGSHKRGGATDPTRLANGVRDHTRAESSKMPGKPIKPTEIKEEVSIKSRSAHTARESKDLQCKKPSNVVVNANKSEAQVEVLKKFGEASDPKVAAPAREEVTMKEDEEVAGYREQEQEAVEEEDDDDDDDGVLCAVCRSTHGDPSDPIVFCNGCDLMVHASCYGNPLAQSIPDGDWFCSLCSDKAAQAAKPSATAKKGRPLSRPCCRLCPARGGAMKRVGAHRVRAARAGGVLPGPRRPRRHRLLPRAQPPVHQGMLRLREQQGLRARVLPAQVRPRVPRLLRPRRRPVHRVPRGQGRRRRRRLLLGAHQALGKATTHWQVQDCVKRALSDKEEKNQAISCFWVAKIEDLHLIILMCYWFSFSFLLLLCNVEFYTRRLEMSHDMCM